MVDPVAHARNYPFPVPGKSYIFRNGEVIAYRDEEIDKTLDAAEKAFAAIK